MTDVTIELSEAAANELAAALQVPPPAPVTPWGFVTPWAEYAANFSGFGSVTVAAMFSRRVGDSVEIQGSFVTGAPTSAEARVSLPSGLTVDSAKVPSRRHCGSVVRGAAVNAQYNATMNGGDDHLKFSIMNGSFAGLTPRAGNIVVGAAGETVSIHAVVPISGW